MSISIFPEPDTGAAAADAFAATLPTMRTVFEQEQIFEPGVYTISVNPTSTNVRCTFASGSAIVTTQNTTSGTVSFNLTTQATTVFILGLIGGSADAVVTIQKTADSLVSTDIGNGTLDTINTTGTYNQTGLLGVLVLSGGQQGVSAASSTNNDPGQSGGRAGFINSAMVYTSGATTVTIGAGGVASLNAPVEPTDSSFGNLVTATSASNIFPNGNGGAGSGGSTPGNGNASGFFPSFKGNETTGGGGGSSKGSYGEFGTGAGSGIGTGGNGSPAANSSGIRAGSGTGKASGGGGGKSGSNNTARLAGDGGPGVVYVLRGF